MREYKEMPLDRILKLPVWFLLLAHMGLVLGTWVVLQYMRGDWLIMPNEHWLKKWDCEHYFSIANGKYEYSPDYGTNTAFFPGFPLLIRLLGSNALYVCMANALMLFVGAWIMVKQWGIGMRDMLLYLSLPTCMFFYVPYSEAMFFLGGALLLVGLKKGQLLKGSLGAAISAASRTAGSVFAPALVGSMIVTGEWKAKKWWLMLLVTIGATLLCAYYQYLDTGNMWGYIETQKHWQHRLSVPKLPFTSWGQSLWIDYIAVSLGLAALLLILQIWRKRIKGKPLKEQGMDGSIVFSLFVIGGFAMLSLLFKQGSLYSTHRYIIPTAFMCVALPTLRKWIGGLSRNKLWILTILYVLAMLYLCHAYVTLHQVLKHIVIMTYLGLIIREVKWRGKVQGDIAWLALYIAGMVVQSRFLQDFINKGQEGWVALAL